MKTILIADDSANGREFLKTVLIHAGYAVVETANGQEAIETAANCEPDLIILDLQMPVKDGYQTAAELRRMEEFRTMPIIALTAFAMEGDREKALTAGFTVYLTKPIRMGELREKVRALLD